MADDLVSMVQGYLTSDVTQKAASYVGETPGNVSKAMSGIVPTILAALQGYASGPDGPNRLMGLVDRSGSNMLGRLPEMFGGGAETQTALAAGQAALGSVLGDKTGPIANQIASNSGIRASSATSLMALIAPIVLGVLGRQRAAQGLNAAGLASLVAGQSGLTRLIPGGVGSLLGLTGLAGVGSRTVETGGMVQPSAVTVIREPERRPGWLIPLAVLAAIALGLWAWTQSHTTIPTAEVPTANMATVALCGGNSLSLAPNSFNYNLGTYLGSTTDTTVPKTFVFDHLNFDTGTTTLTSDSQPTVTTLITILKDCPTAQVRLDGYTDNTGAADANMKLSQDRADAVKVLLVNGGVDASRITTMGHGQNDPIASNDTDEGKAKNRRTQLTVLKK